MRACEAKLRGRMTIVVSIPGPPGCENGGVFLRGSLCFCRDLFGFKGFVFFVKAFSGLASFLFDSTVLGGHDLQKHVVE